MWDRRDWVCCACGVVPQSAEQVYREVEAADAASVARLVRVDARNTRGGYVCSVHVYVGLVVAWSGGCGSWSAAKSSGAQPPSIFVTWALPVASLWWCMMLDISAVVIIIMGA